MTLLPEPWRVKRALPLFWAVIIVIILSELITKLGEL